MLDSLVRVSRRVLRVPNAKASWTGVNRGLSESYAASSRSGPVSALGPTDGLNRPRLPRAGRENRGPAPLSAPSSGPAGTPRVRRKAEALRAGSTAGRRPTPNGSRLSTRGEVHTFAALRWRRRGRRGRRPSHRRHSRASRRAESPHSIFRVSQVYP